MSEISLRGVKKAYGQVTVVEELSLSIRDGEFLVIVGPSGCGKSTLLRMIAGLEPITDGELMIGATRANDLPPQKRNISMVFQTYALFPHMTVRQNISFGPEVRREDPVRTAQQIARAADVLNLTKYLERRPSELSGGQRQRVAMGRAIVREPAAFLFDEPLSNLDAHLRVEMRTEIKSLHTKLGSTIVYVTHDQIEAMTMADRIVIMNEGRIEQVGEPMELYERPANLFVAAFLGSPAMSFFPVTYVAGDKGARIEFSDGISLAVEQRSIGSGTPVTAGIRPYAYSRAGNGPLTLNVEVVEPTGSEVHVTGTIAGQRVRCVLRDREIPRVSQPISLDVGAGDIHLFEPGTGNRL
ncbi:MAG: sn-glycerol-3-phosphate ABC transporter ATP-binding protein UgpC [Devosia sp.]